VDGLHPQHWSVLYMMYKNFAASWFEAALQALPWGSREASQ
jgi:hypothetical protein